MTLTDEVRAFNRFYMCKIGLLNRSLPATYSVLARGTGSRRVGPGP